MPEKVVASVSKDLSFAYKCPYCDTATLASIKIVGSAVAGTKADAERLAYITLENRWLKTVAKINDEHFFPNNASFCDNCKKPTPGNLLDVNKQIKKLLLILLPLITVVFTLAFYFILSNINEKIAAEGIAMMLMFILPSFGISAIIYNIVKKTITRRRRKESIIEIERKGDPLMYPLAPDIASLDENSSDPRMQLLCEAYAPQLKEYQAKLAYRKTLETMEPVFKDSGKAY